MPDIMQQIRERAYQIWQEQGEPEDLATDHWLQAEKELSEGGADIVNIVRSKKVGAAAASAVAGVNDPVEDAEQLE